MRKLKLLLGLGVLLSTFMANQVYASPAKDKYFAKKCFAHTNTGLFLDPQTGKPTSAGYDSKYRYWPIKTIAFPFGNQTKDVIVIEVTKTEKWGDRTTHKAICEVISGGWDFVQSIPFNENGMYNGLHYSDFY